MKRLLIGLTIAISMAAIPTSGFALDIQPVKSATPVGPGVTWTEIHCKHLGFRHPVCYPVIRAKHPGMRELAPAR